MRISDWSSDVCSSDLRRRAYASGDPEATAGGAVAVISEAAIRELAGIRGGDAPITSVYLDVDGRRLVRQQDVEHELETMLRSARQRANGHRSVHEDIDRIESFVRGGLDRKSMRGLAIFASSATDLWKDRKSTR